ncbi:unnamed protein product, partial [Ectocarpus sp. 13 AM-2016]
GHRAEKKNPSHTKIRPIPPGAGTCRFSADSHETRGTQQKDRLTIGTNTRGVEPHCDALFPQIFHMVPVRCAMVRSLFLFFSTSVTVKPYRTAPAPHSPTPSKTTCREHADQFSRLPGGQHTREVRNTPTPKVFTAGHPPAIITAFRFHP